MKNQKSAENKEEKRGPQKPPGLKGIGVFLKPFWFSILVLMALGVVSNGVSLLIPKTIGESLDAYAAGEFDSSRTLWFLLAVTGVTLAASLFQRIMSRTVTEKLALRLRNALAEAVSRQSYQFIRGQSAAKLLTNFTSDVNEVKDIISQGIVTIVSAIVMIIGSAYFMFSIQPKLAGLTIITLPAMIVVFQYVMSRVRKLFGEARVNTDRLNKIITEAISGSMLVRVLSSKPEFAGRFDEANTEARSIGYRLLSQFGGFLPILNLLSSASIIIVVWYGGIQVIDGFITVGDFTAFYSYLAGLLTPVFIIGFVSSTFIRAGVAFGRIQQVLKAEPEDPGAGELPALEGTLTFENVSLEVAGKPVLQNASFDIPFEKYTAIIGPTAAGKTHVLYMLLGLLSPTSGRIFVNGEDLVGLHTESFLERCGVVFQDQVIFTGTVRENVALGRDVTDEQIWAALELADLREFVEESPDGLDTDISERGSNLSGGQKQRVSLARAVLAQPDILLLDDFTARVDRATDKRIRERLQEAFPNQTQIVVAQTIESIQDAEQIVLLMEGEVVATGTHQHLLEHCFEYQQIYQSQTEVAE